MDFSNLQKIGLTNGEIKVYQALLDLGECTKTTLVKKAKIAPSNVYDITNRLIEKGIISKVIKNGIAHFSPANPKHILNFLDLKKKELEKERDIVTEILPTLLARYKDSKEKVNIEVFQGWNGLKTIFEDLIDDCKKEDQNYVFGASKGESDKQTDRFFLKYSLVKKSISSMFLRFFSS